MDEETKFRDLELRRERMEVLGYVLANTPISVAHQDYLAKASPPVGQQTGNARSAPKDASPDAHSPSQSWSSRGQRSFSDSQSSGTSDIGSSVIYNGELLADNEWPVLLHFDNDKQFEGKVLLDSGCRDNWISMEIVKRHGLPYQEERNKTQTYKDFSSHEVHSIGLAKSFWIYNHKTIPIEFKIAEAAPFDILFGYRFLLKWGLITFCPAGLVAPLVRNSKPGPAEKAAIQGDEKKVAKENERIKRYLDWKKKMKAEGWQWDKTQNNFFRSEGGKTVWNPSGFLLNLRVDGPGQRNP